MASKLVGQPLPRLESQHAGLRSSVSGAVSQFVKTFALSPREYDVLVAFLAHRSNKAAAASLKIGYTTVQMYWTRICRKAGCADQLGVLLMLLGDGVRLCPQCRRANDATIPT